jgi:hypothetical protein
VLRRADRDYRMLRSALSNRLMLMQSPSAADLTREMNPHVWLQAESQGKWIDLDPSFPDSKVGQSYATADREVSELPAELYQRITIRIVAEQVRGSALSNRTLLETQRTAEGLLDAQVGLTHTKPAALGGLGAAIAGAFGAQTDEWMPLLLIQGKALSGERLNVNDPSFVAEWLEFELEWPGGRRELTRRAIADRAGAAWRRATPLDAATLRPLEHDDSGSFDLRAVHNIWLSAGRHNLADLADGLQQLALLAADDALRAAEQGSGGSQAADQDPGQALWPFALQNFTWMLWTDHVALPLVNDNTNIRLYPDSPRIAIFSQRPDAGGSISFTTDLRRDTLRGVSSDGTLALALGEKKLRFCALEGALEHEALTLMAAASGARASTVQTTSGASTSTDVLVLEPGKPVPDLKGRFDRESAARIADVLAAGYTVVAPGSAPGSVPGWWRISATGDGAAVGYQGLNAGHLLPYVPKNPLKTAPTPQQNAFDGQKINDGRTAKEKFDEAYEARRAKQIAKAEKEAADYRARTGQPEPQPKGGGNEYGVLVTAVTILGGIAMKIVGIISFIWTCAGIEELIFQMQNSP